MLAGTSMVPAVILLGTCALASSLNADPDFQAGEPSHPVCDPGAETRPAAPPGG